MHAVTQAMTRRTPPTPAADAERASILLVDDLPEKLLVLETVLADLGQELVVARSGEEALRKVLEQEFAVILLDINMPGMDGLETAAYIRRRKKSAHTPIIFITAYADEMQTTQGYSLGAVDYILSPVVPEVLRTKVKVFVDLFLTNQQVRRQADERVALAREQAARAAAEEASARLAFLAGASTVLSSSLDVDMTLRGMLQVVVPYLADLAGVTLAEPGRAWKTVMSWLGPDGSAMQTLELAAADAPEDELRRAVDRVLATGESESLSGLRIPYPPADDAPAGLENLLASALVVPLRARGRTLGALTLAMRVGGRRYGPAERTLAEDLASRAAIALDNARLYQNIQEGDRRKNEFLAMLAHELRNPLAPIRNAVHVLRMIGSPDETLGRARDMIERQVTHMARLIDDLLDMSRLSRGKILLRKEPLDLVDLVRDTAEDYRTILEGTGLRLRVGLPDGKMPALGDPTRLCQVLGNVLHNANKFTDTGGEVAVELRPDGKGGALLVIADTGIGMERGMLDRVFETFSQADSSLDRSRGGLGLGLALVKGLVELHGGEVRADSDGLGTGTRITIRLPLAAAPAAANGAPESRPTAAELRRVLVIEDNPDAAESMRMLFALHGHEVRVAFAGPTGLQAAREFAPEVILCDIGLPGGMDGYAVARAVRGDPALGSTRLIALSGYGQEDDQRRSHEAGFDAHLTKPVDFPELQKLLGALSRASRAG